MNGLIQLNVYLTHTASLACRCCPLSPPGTNGHGPFLPVETIFQAVREALPLGLQSVQLSGGEPFLYPDFDALIDRLESLELGVIIETTGAGVTAERAKRLARLPQAKVYIGLDTPGPAVRDGLREAPGADGKTPPTPALPADAAEAGCCASHANADASGRADASMYADATAQTDAFVQAIAAAETTAAAARLLSAAGLPPRFVCALTRRNSDQLPALIRLAELLGAESVDFVSARPVKAAPVHTGGDGKPSYSAAAGRGGDGKPSYSAAAGRGGDGKPSCSAAAERRGLPALLNTDLLAVEELIALGRKIERELSLVTRLRLSFAEPPAFRGLQPQSPVEGHGRCDPLTTLSLLPTGEYALCGAAGSAGAALTPLNAAGSAGAGRNSVPPPLNAAGSANSSTTSSSSSLIFGRARAGALAEIWHTHPILRELREGLPDRLEGVCGRCIMKSACLGYCPAENYLRTGAFWGPNWFCQTAERVGLFPAGRLIENIW